MIAPHKTPYGRRCVFLGYLKDAVHKPGSFLWTIEKCRVFLSGVLGDFGIQPPKVAPSIKSHFSSSDGESILLGCGDWNRFEILSIAASAIETQCALQYLPTLICLCNRYGEADLEDSLKAAVRIGVELNPQSVEDHRRLLEERRRLVAA